MGRGREGATVKISEFSHYFWHIVVELHDVVETGNYLPKYRLFSENSTYHAT
jgi:hypothetical protein